MSTNWQQRYEELAAAVRLRSDDPALLHLVGPSEQEQAEAERRIARLEHLSPLCQWDSLLPNYGARIARQAWARIMDAQQDFEARYC